MCMLPLCIKQVFDRCYDLSSGSVSLYFLNMFMLRCFLWRYLFVVPFLSATLCIVCYVRVVSVVSVVFVDCLVRGVCCVGCGGGD